MITKIKTIAHAAINKLEAEARLTNSQEQRTRINAALETYQELSKLIDSAEREQATAGLLLLSCQLTNPFDNLNALDLGLRFSKIRAYQLKRTSELSNAEFFYEVIRGITAIFFAVTCMLLEILLPACMMLAAGVVSGSISVSLFLLAPVSALCLAALCYFDNTLSISNLYRGLAGLEYVLGGFGLLMGALSAMEGLVGSVLVLFGATAVSPIVPLLWLASAACLLPLSYVLMKDSNANLERADKFDDISKQYDRNSNYNFFRNQAPEQQLHHELSHINEAYVREQDVALADASIIPGCLNIP